MSSRTPPKLAAALLRRMTEDSSLIGDLEEEFRHGRSSCWYWSQVAGTVAMKCVHAHACAACVLVAAFVLSIGPTLGWWQTRFAVPVLLGMAITSWKLWRLHRTSLVILYVASVALVSPYWMSGQTEAMTGANWA